MQTSKPFQAVLQEENTTIKVTLTLIPIMLIINCNANNAQKITLIRQ